jgi:hypothetical protein
VDVDDLVVTYPRLYHWATAGSWPAIAQHGLLSTADIVAPSASAPGNRAQETDLAMSPGGSAWR